VCICGSYRIALWLAFVPVETVVPVTAPSASLFTELLVDELLPAVVSVRSWKSVKRYSTRTQTASQEARTLR
jgi:hypothetical protein